MKMASKYFSNSAQRQDAGYFFVSAIFFMLVAAIAVTALMRVAGTQRSMLSHDILEKQAQTAADSGIEWVLWYIKDEYECPDASDRQFTIDVGAADPVAVSIDCQVSLHREVKLAIALTRQVWKLKATATYGAQNEAEHIVRESNLFFTQPLPLL